MDTILAQCGGFVIFPHILHRSLSLLDFLLLLPLPPDLESELLCENLHLSPRAQVPMAKCLQGVVALHAHLWSPLAPFPVPDEPSLRRVSASITAHPAALRSMAEYSFPGSFGASKSVVSCDIVEVSGATRDRLQGLHDCFFGWRTSSRLQLDALGKPLVKRSRVLSCARKDLFVQHSQDRAA